MIGSIESFPPATSAQAVTPNVGSGRTDARPESGAAAEGATEPVSGTLPKQETSVVKNAPATYQLPEDVVEVHQDPETKNRVIIQYLDKFKDVVLQVPSNLELSLERGIAREFQQAAKQRASADAAAAESQGEKTHGD
jgi:hypothetical protein